ncbi:YbgF trimerization domain-containing protein [Sphingomonas jatrophae]|uniref:TolA-binding protein n=1 Tax=Sphingomonas jatrophae TaxID=1166337 RepID=A0A1I6L332_9SPHN|nr:YbgF trimerization domain-containing protein [Sphingomonas jatrophae]SFR97923.1 TolA-binding protein [Sphingomonas jatrophae]
MKRIVAALMLSAMAPAYAQSGAQPGVTQRVDRLEREMRAVQRKVFPGSSKAPGYLEPEISAPAAPAPTGGIPASAPITDLTARVNSLEQEMSRMTGQLEQNSFKLRQLEEQVQRLRADSDARLDASMAAPTTGAIGPAATPSRPAAEPSRPASGRPGTTAPVEAEPEQAAAPAGSGDAGEDAYLAGYRLWSNKKYPEAETALKAFVAKYPNHKRASFAQNLLGRTYLDSGRPAAAAVAFHKNFTGNPRGERAPDSLYFLGQSLMKLDKPNAAKACEAYDALLREYGTTISADLKAKVAKGQTDAKCKVGA